MASVKNQKPGVSSMVDAEEALIDMRLLDKCIAKYDAEIALATASKTVAEKDRRAIEKEIVKWAVKDRKTWTGKTLTLVNGVISFQTSPGKVSIVKTIAKTWEDVLALLIRSRKNAFAQFLRPQQPRIDKELITAEFSDGRITNEELAIVGLKVEKPELCVIEVVR